MAQMFTKGFKPKSTTKEAKKIIREEIKFYYGDDPQNRRYGNDYLMNMREDAETYAKNNRSGGYSDWYKGSQLVDGGCFRCYYDEQRAFLKKIYGSSVDKWSNDKVYSTYKSLIGREYSQMLQERKRKGN